MPRLRHFLSTLSIAMYPLFARSLCTLCLHTITPMGSFEAESLEYAYKTIEVSNFGGYECMGMQPTHQERQMWPMQGRRQ
jgi:hypothetical protein